MNNFTTREMKDGFTLKLWRGERMCLIGLNIEQPEDDFVGFAIEYQEPGARGFKPLMNRLAFSYATSPEEAVTGDRKFPSTEAPFQKFRWIHFPFDVKDGVYTYRATKMHMVADGVLTKGTSVEAKISLNSITYDNFLDIGFTRNFASSQAFREKLGNPANIDEIGASIIPSSGDRGLEFNKLSGDIYEWMGFEAYELLFGFLDEVIADSNVTVDVFAYDFNEPDLLAKLQAFGDRLRIIIDDSDVDGGHGAPDSPESKVSQFLSESAGASNVKRTHFRGLQHNKVFIAKRDGVPFKALAGSTNFSYRGFYIQANNVLVFKDADIAGLFGQFFEEAFKNPESFQNSDLANKWHMVKKPGLPAVHLCFSPHKSTDLPLKPIQGAIAQASSSVFYAVAFLNQMRDGQLGLTKKAFDGLMKRPIFSYGISDKGGSLEVKKPDGSIGLVDFNYLAEHAPEPFKREWSGGQGINIHHKFVVTDFNLPTAKVFTGSSNLSPSGEKNNGDHLIMIEDRRIATVYTIEALRLFDHLHFRSKMEESTSNSVHTAKKTELKLRKPKAISGDSQNWFEVYYRAGTQKENDRLLFSGPDIE